MTWTLTPSQLEQASAVVARRIGLHFPEERWADLQTGLKAACEELGLERPGECLAKLIAGDLSVQQMEIVVGHLTVGETYFFREPATSELLRLVILPRLIEHRTASNKSLRLWSAGCCTGEEAYSLAITCLQALPDPSGWNLSVLATDINQKFLAKARAGVYSPWSFRGTPKAIKDRYFTSQDERSFVIDPKIKKYVTFRYLNLAEDAFLSLHNGTNGIDIIFCRNVLMYFTHEHQRRVVQGLFESLVEGGLLLVNPAEGSPSLFPQFARKEFDGIWTYSRESASSHGQKRPADMGSPDPLPMRDEPQAAFVLQPGPGVEPQPVFLPDDEAPPLPNPILPSVETSVDALIAAARESADKGELEEAASFCADAVSREQVNLTAHFLHAMILQELRRDSEAIAALGRVLYLDGDFILAHHALGGLFQRLGKVREARRHLSIALRLLQEREAGESVPESGGMTCGRLLQSVRSMMGVGL